MTAPRREHPDGLDAPVLAGGRTFPGRRPVRLGDVTATGRLRLDAIARYLQDVATDDAADVGLADGWVLRRLAFRVDRFPTFREVVDLTTWCAGVAASAAERRTSLAVDGGTVLEALALWVFVGPDGRPARLDRDRFAVYGIPTDRRISTRLRHDDVDRASSRSMAWPLRAADVDVLAHVNNAISLAALEDVVREEGLAEHSPPWSVEVEYRHPIDPGERPELVWAPAAHDTIAAALRVDGSPRTTFRVVVPSAVPSAS